MFRQQAAGHDSRPIARLAARLNMGPCDPPLRAQGVAVNGVQLSTAPGNAGHQPGIQAPAVREKSPGLLNMSPGWCPGHKGDTPLWFVLKNKDTRFNSCSGNKLPDMTHARSRVLLPGPIWVHAIHRCVRKAWLSMAFSYRRAQKGQLTDPPVNWKVFE